MTVVREIRAIVDEQIGGAPHAGTVVSVGVGAISVRLLASGNIIPNVHVVGGAVASLSVGDPVWLLYFAENNSVLALHAIAVVNGEPVGGAPSAHSHSGLYYSRGEMDAMLLLKQDRGMAGTTSYIEATSGTVGGWTITGTQLYADSNNAFINSAIPAIGLGTTGYLAGTGFWAGKNASVYKLHIGNPAGNRLAWDGTTLTLVTPSIADFTNAAHVHTTGAGGGATIGATTFNGAAVSATGIWTFSNVTYSALFTGGNVGINTATPGSPLDIKGILRLSGATSGYVGLAPATNAGSTIYTLPTADGSSGQVLSTSGGGVLSWITGVPGPSAWSALTDPSANLSLTMAARTSTLTYNAATGAANLFVLTDTTNNTGTGYLLNLLTAAGSALKPFRVSAAGIEALNVSADGGVGIGTTAITAGFQLHVQPSSGGANVKFVGATSANLSLVKNASTNSSTARFLTGAGTDFMIGTGIYTANSTQLDIGTGSIALVTIFGTGEVTVANGLNVGTATEAGTGEVRTSAGTLLSGVNDIQAQMRSIPVNNNSTAQLPNVSGSGAGTYGMVFIMDASSHFAIFAIAGAGNATQELLDTSAKFSTTAGTATSTNIYWSAGNGRYEIENKSGSSETYRIFFMVNA